VIGPAIGRLVPNVLEEGIVVRVGDDRFLDEVAAREVIGDREARSESVEPAVIVSRISLLLEEEAVFGGDEETEIADACEIDAGVVDLVEDAVADREPDSAAARRADSRLRAGCPSGWDAWSAGCITHAWRRLVGGSW